MGRVDGQKRGGEHAAVRYEEKLRCAIVLPWDTVIRRAR